MVLFWGLGFSIHVYMALPVGFRSKELIQSIQVKKPIIIERTLVIHVHVHA